MIVVAHQHRKLRFSRKETSRAINAVLRSESNRRKSISVVYVNDRFMRTINRVFLRHDFVTDVIAFPLEDGMGIDAELYVNLDRARSQAKEAAVAFQDEVRRLLIHGTLHLLGYRDSTPKYKRGMTRKEGHYLDQLNKG